MGFIAVFFLTLTTACKKDNNCVTGSGSTFSRDFFPAEFSALSIHGMAEVIISKDTVQSLHIEGQNEILNALNVEVISGTLTIGKDNCFKNYDRLKIYISTPTLRRISSSGTVDVISSDQFSETSFSASISGLGTFNLNLDVENFSGSTSGHGVIIAKGIATNQLLSSSGEAVFYCFDLKGENVEIKVSGTAIAEVHATTTLDIEVSGHADIFYKGYPTINQNISGSVTVTDAN